MFGKFITFLLFSFFIYGQLTAFAQTNTGKEAQTKNTPTAKPEISPELKKATLELLQETSGMIGGLNSPENRVNYSLKAGGLFWKHDQKEARRLFLVSSNELRQLISLEDNFANLAESLVNNSKNNTDNRPFQISNFLSQASENSPFINNSLRLRNQVVTEIANYDVVLAYNFLRETTLMISNTGLRENFEKSDKSLEAKIAHLLAREDPAKGLEIARSFLNDANFDEAIKLMEVIYSKDSKIGSNFADEVFDKLKNAKPDFRAFKAIKNLFDIGHRNTEALEKNKSDKQPLFSTIKMRELAEFVFEKVGIAYSPSDNKIFEKYSPQVAETLRRQQSQAPKSSGKIIGGTGDESLPQVKIAPTSSSIRVPATPLSSALEAYRKEQNAINALFNQIGKDKASEEKIKEDIEKAKSLFNEIENPALRNSMKISLAQKLIQIEKKDEAFQLLNEVEASIPSQLKKQSEFFQVWRLVSVYSEISPDKSFSLLENGIFQLNETISAFLKVSEFAAFNTNLKITKGEFVSSESNLNRFFQLAPHSAKNLAKHDFNRLKNAIDRFNQPELRVEYRMMIVSALLTEPKPEPSTGGVRAAD